MVENIWLWVGFLSFVLIVLAMDLGIFHRQAHAVSVKEAAIWTGVWVTLALLFGVGIYLFWHLLVPGSSYTNQEATAAYLTAYLVEESLSVDNIFVFVLIFTYFAVPGAYQHRVLFWGVLGAWVMRGVLIVTGSALIHRFEWVLYLFGIFLIYTGVRLATSDSNEVEPDKNPVVKWVRRYFPVSEEYSGHSFFVRYGGALAVTPLLLVLVVVETTDLVFALDSIPAIFAVSRDPFIMFTSNVFAILGLRSLYFLLADMMDRFHYLKFGLAIVLSFIGAKMVVADFIHVSIWLSLGIVAAVIGGSVVISLLTTAPTPIAAPGVENLE